MMKTIGEFGVLTTVAELLLVGTVLITARKGVAEGSG